MSEYNIMKKTLADQWYSLPVVLQAHYQTKDNTDVGMLDIEYPAWMQVSLNLLNSIGALLNRKGNAISTEVKKVMHGNVQHWSRTITFENGEKVYFKSHWCHVGGNKMIEFVNPIIGLCMSVEVNNKSLYYQGEYFVLRLGKLTIPIAEWMLLGHTTIVEKEFDDNHFTMDFRLRHPLFGQIYRYSGKFMTVNN